jgi:hypothetical protein
VLPAIDLADATEAAQVEHDATLIGTAPPVLPVPPPRGTSGTRASDAARSAS